MIHDLPWWFLLLMALAWWFPQNIIHEGSHGIVYKMLGYTITKFAPWPNKTPDGKWRFAAIWSEWQREDEDKPSQRVRSWAAIAPVLTNAVLFPVMAIHALFPDMNDWVQGVMYGLAVTNFADGANNWRSLWMKDTGDHGCDVWRFYYKQDISLTTLRVLSVCWWAAGLTSLVLITVLPLP